MRRLARALLGALVLAVFVCHGQGKVLVWKTYQTPQGEVVCLKKRIKFKNAISLPQPSKEEVYTLNCPSS